MRPFLGCDPFKSSSAPVKNKCTGFFWGVNRWRCSFFNGHPSHPGKLDRAVGGFVPHGCAGWVGVMGAGERCPRLVSRFIFPSRGLPWKRKIIKGFGCVASWSMDALPGWQRVAGITVHPCWDGVGGFVITPPPPPLYLLHGFKCFFLKFPSPHTHTLNVGWEQLGRCLLLLCGLM